MALNLSPEQTDALIKLGFRVKGIPTLHAKGTADHFRAAIPNIPTIQRKGESVAKKLEAFLRNIQR